MNNIMIVVGVCTLLQAFTQMVLSGLGLAQYACFIDFMRDIPFLIFIRILYFHNPITCGLRINIGQSIEGMADQAFVLLAAKPFTVMRTYIINCVYAGFSILWIITSVILMVGGAKDSKSKRVRWPWILVTVITCGLDITSTVTYANDTFHTQSLTDIVEYIGARVSGAPAAGSLSTSMVSWTMVILFSRLIVFFILNMIFIILIILQSAVPFNSEDLRQLEASINYFENPNKVTTASPDESIDGSSSIAQNLARIPRPGLSQSFRHMKQILFKKSTSVTDGKMQSSDSLDNSPERSPRPTHYEVDKKRTVNFPENLLSLPQRLENMIAEQRKKLEQAIDTSGRRSPPRVSQSLPQLFSNIQEAPSQVETANLMPSISGRRGTVADLQSQLPWAYIPSSTHRMRDQLPPDEDLPPVPLPDYNAIPLRKASVHRAASSLSSMTNRRVYLSSQSRGQRIDGYHRKAN